MGEDVQFYHAGDVLSFTVKDSDPLKADDLLGKVMLTADQFLPDGFSGEVQLTDAGEGSEAFLTLEIVIGKIERLSDALDQTTDEIVKENGADPNVCVAQEDPVVVETKVAPNGLCC